MNGGAGVTAGAVAAAAATANAIKASGAIVRVSPMEFLAILQRAADALVVRSEGGVFSRRYRYLTSYKGLIFFTKSMEPLDFPHGTEVIEAKKIWVPD